MKIHAPALKTFSLAACAALVLALPSVGHAAKKKRAAGRAGQTTPTVEAMPTPAPPAAPASDGYAAQPSPTPAPHSGPRLSYSSVHVEGPYIALTFDDGPGKETTPRLLDLLARRKVRATFFILGSMAAANPQILKREAAEGHEIANHSWDHPNLGKMSAQAVLDQLQRTQNEVFALTGAKPRLMRPPYGSFTDAQKRWVAETLGLKVILWDVDPLDWKRPGPAVVARRIVDQTQAGSIILVHDIHAQTVDAMAATLDGLLARGFRFVTVSELLAMEKPLPPKPVATPAAVPEPAAPAAPSAPPAQPAWMERVPAPAGRL